MRSARTRNYKNTDYFAHSMLTFFKNLFSKGNHITSWIMNLREKNFLVDLFSPVIFFNISRGFNFANWLPVNFSRGFTFANLSFINVLYILILSRFVLQRVVCGSRNSCLNFWQF